MATKLRKLLDVALKHHAKISFLGYIVGVIWFVALVHPSLNNRTYFSENALLPGMVDTQYVYGKAAKSLKDEIENPSEIYRDNFPLWLMDKMTAIGLESYRQNFTVQFPKDLAILNKQISGTNVYGILRAPRTAGTEALVFSVPLKPETSGPFYELVLLLSLAEHFRNHIYWAKDIIFLVADQNEIGTQSWLDEYHGLQSKYVRSSRMLGRSGAIQAAINLELDDQDISYMQLMVESLNGQLPNLDLVNMVSRLCNDEGIPVALNHLLIRHFNDGWDEHRSSLSTMVLMMLNQASGRPSANHGLFPKYGIEAVTLRGKKETGAGSVSLGRLGRALEGMFRSLNSLLERFHQSFFFYLLPSTSRYISIGLYMPPLGCLMVGPILAAITCWIASVKIKDELKDDHDRKEKADKSENDEKQEDKTSNEGTTKSSKPKEKESVREDEPEEFAFTRTPRHFGSVLRVILAGHFVGLTVYISPYTLRYIGVIPFDLKPSSFVICLIFGTFLLGLNLPLLLRAINFRTEKDLLLLKSFALVIYTCQVGCLATVNFSLGFFLAIFSVPAFLVVRSTQNRLRRLFQIVLVSFSSPPFIMFLMCLAYSYFTTDNDNCHEVLQNTKTLYADCILSSLRDSVLIGTWSYPVITLIILPNWLLFWSIAWM